MLKSTIRNQELQITKLKAEKEAINNKDTNRNVLLNFLSYRLKMCEVKSRTSKDVINTQNEKLKILGEERKTYQEKNKLNLKQSFIQAGMIMKQEAQKEDLKEALKIERNLRQDLLNLTEILDVSNVNMFPTYVQTMHCNDKGITGPKW